MKILFFKQKVLMTNTHSNKLEFCPNWFSKVEASVIQQYESLKVKGDIDNSVLAGFLLFDIDKKIINVLSLATGTKLMSGDQRKNTAKTGPTLVHDCHAEILAHRALQVWIWQNIDNTEYFENGKMKEKYSLHFYSSTPPCGDCCVHILSDDNFFVQTGAKPFGWDQNQLATSPPNYVRGKPGKGSRSQSVSCSDKICLWIHLGLEGSLLSKFVSKLPLLSICIGDGDLNTCRRALINRVSSDNDKKIKIFVDKPRWKQKNLSPSASSYVWWNTTNSKNYELIAAKFGRKLGVTEKKQAIRKFFSELCDAVMIERFCQRNKIERITLNNAKKLNEEYCQNKDIIKSKLISYGGIWCTKFEDERNWEYNSSTT